MMSTSYALIQNRVKTNRISNKIVIKFCGQSLFHSVIQYFNLNHHRCYDFTNKIFVSMVFRYMLCTKSVSRNTNMQTFVYNCSRISISFFFCRVRRRVVQLMQLKCDVNRVNLRLINVCHGWHLVSSLNGITWWTLVKSRHVWQVLIWTRIVYFICNNKKTWMWNICRFYAVFL